MYWSYLLAIIGVAGIFFVGRKDKWGWFVLLFNEVLWTAYAIITQQYGFILSAIAYGIVYIRSYIHWSKEPVNTFLEHKDQEVQSGYSTGKWSDDDDIHPTITPVFGPNR